MDHSAAPETTRMVLEFFTPGERVSCSLDDLAHHLGISRTNLSRAVKALVASGALVKVRRGTGPGFPTTWERTERPAPANPYLVEAPDGT